ncbi:Intermembrane phospholipid transport system lipoprotein MlaA [Burkholderiales bacterium]|nr:Intermembrane phospholipid transport system lipoprotein MlaA [Burkholderiales bacterium]
MSVPRRVRTGSAAALALAAALSGCATMQEGASSRADPFEPVNRAMYAIHEPIDTNLVRPLAQAWVDYVPRPVQSAVRTFFGNIDDGFSALNGLLQGKWDKAGDDLGRITVNVWGLGLIDIASEAGIPKGEEDFGQTFGFWGIPQGPYLFVPLIGPTTVRDGTGLGLRFYLGPLGYVDEIPLRNVLYGLGALDRRAEALDASAMVDRAAIDKYTFIRRSYLQRREYMVHDGNPPRKDDDE